MWYGSHLRGFGAPSIVHLFAYFCFVCLFLKIYSEGRETLESWGLDLEIPLLLGRLESGYMDHLKTEILN